MLKQDERETLIELCLEKSQDKLNASKDFYDVHPEEAVSAAYYSVFHAVQALFLQDRLNLAKKRGHRSVIALFNREYVYPGIFSWEMKKTLGQLESIRNKSDYEPQMQITAHQAQECIVKAEKFNAAIREHIQKQQQQESRKATEQTQDSQGQEQVAQANKADLNELESATALLKNQRAADNTTFKGHEVTPQQNDTLDLLEQIRKHIQADKAAMTKLENAGISPDKDITIHKVARPGKFLSAETQGLEVVSRTRDSLMLIRGRCLFIYELKLLELQAPAQGVPGEKLDLEWPKTQEKARAAKAQEQERKRIQGRGRGLSL